MTLPARLRRPVRRVRNALLRRGVLVDRVDDADREFRTRLSDPRWALPPDDEAALSATNPRLAEIRRRYETVDDAVRVHSQWRTDSISPMLDLRSFRGDNAYVWHYRQGGLAMSRLRFLLYATDVAAHDQLGLLDQIVEDGAFGCWSYDFAGRRPLSRATLDAVGELNFLDRHLPAGATPFRALDIGAGYGRLAYHAVDTGRAQTYVCTDAVAESSFLSEFYLRHRGVDAAASVYLLDEVGNLAPGAFDVAINIHSFSECTLGAIAWWMGQLERLDVPSLFVLPNEADGFLSLETDGRRLDYLPTITAAGYELVAEEHVIGDPAIRSELDVHDRRCFFRRTLA